MNQALTRVSCDLCGCANPKQLPYAYRYLGELLYVVQCPSCGLRFVNPRPSESELLSLYSADYFEKDYVCGFWEGNYVSNRDKLLAEAEQVLNLLNSHGISGGALLDVGCAGGYFLLAARQRGFGVTGVEINRDMADFASRAGCSVHLGTLESAQFAENSFDIVVLCDVLEHVASPKRLLTQVHRILKPEGHLYIRGPIDATLAGALFRRLRIWRRGRLSDIPGLPYHVYEFTPRTLQRYLKMAGFVCRWMRSGETFSPRRMVGQKCSAKTACELAIRSISKFASLLPLAMMGDFIEILAKKQSTTSEDATHIPVVEQHLHTK